MKKQKVQKRVEAYCLHPSVPDSCTSIFTWYLSNSFKDKGEAARMSLALSDQMGILKLRRGYQKR